MFVEKMVDVVNSVALALPLPDAASKLTADTPDESLAVAVAKVDRSVRLDPVLAAADLEAKLEASVDTLAVEKVAVASKEVESPVELADPDPEDGGVPMMYELILLKMPPVDVGEPLLPDTVVSRVLDKENVFEPEKIELSAMVKLENVEEADEDSIVSEEGRGLAL